MEAFGFGTESGLDQLRKQAKSKATPRRKDSLANACLACLLEGTEAFGSARFQGGLNRLKDGRISSYSKAEGLQPGAVHCLLEGRMEACWIGTRGCLARLQKGAITRL